MSVVVSCEFFDLCYSDLGFSLLNADMVEFLVLLHACTCNFKRVFGCGGLMVNSVIWVSF